MTVNVEYALLEHLGHFRNNITLHHHHQQQQAIPGFFRLYICVGFTKNCFKPLFSTGH